MAASPAMAQDRLENRLDGFDRSDSDDGISRGLDQEADSGDVD